jgi:hypothetical protein
MDDPFSMKNCFMAEVPEKPISMTFAPFPSRTLKSKVLSGAAISW